MVADDGTVIVCEIAPPSDQTLKVFCTPAAVCGELVAMVCVELGIQFSISGAATGAPPSADTSSPAGLVVIVIRTGAVEKLPVTVAGALGMWKLVLEEVVESNVPPVEVQLLNWKVALAVAVTGMLAFAA